jgi:ferric-dicitrate binding protein FerR (iron transport regulator)
LKPKEKLILTNLPPEEIASIKQSTSPSKLLISNLNYVSKTDSSVMEICWITNKLVFHDKSFGSLAIEMEKWYGMNVHFYNEEIKNYRFTGVFEKETIREVLDALKLTEHFNYKIVDTTIYIF